MAAAKAPLSPVVEALGPLAKALDAPETAVREAMAGLATVPCLVELARAWKPTPETPRAVRVAMADALVFLLRAESAEG